MAAFSRLQLAAALIEYDNEDESYSVGRRSATESAIFSHLRHRNLGPRTKTSVSYERSRRSSVDYLAVPPTTDDTANLNDDHIRRSAVSMSSLQNPFRSDILEEHEDDCVNDELEEPEVDLTSWGLDAILPPKHKEKHKPSAHVTHPQRTATALLQQRPIESEVSSIKMDRNSNLSRLNSQAELVDNQWNSADNARHSAPSDTIPFPPLPVDQESDMANNLFEPPMPKANRLSRFDPKVAVHSRTLSGTGSSLFEVRDRSVSGATAATLGSRSYTNRDDYMSSRLSTIHDGSHASTNLAATRRTRTISNSSFDVNGFETGYPHSDYEEDASTDVRNRRQSRMDLLRPRVLVMPSPLQGSDPPSAFEYDMSVREGFETTLDGAPLPPGAKVLPRPGIRPLSASMSASMTPIPTTSNSFTVNPRMSMSLAQLTFRNTLMVDGERDVSYNDIDRQLTRAEAEGEMISSPNEVEEVICNELEDRDFRPAGKLFGTSLIDDLEARKLQIRSKQRVFMGDQRPSMMERNPSSTLVHPSELRSSTSFPRRNAVGAVPEIGSTAQYPIAVDSASSSQDQNANRMHKSASVFGVDRLWETEMAKLRDLEIRDAEQSARLRPGASSNLNSGIPLNSKKPEAPLFARKSETGQLHSSPEREQGVRASGGPPMIPPVQLSYNTKRAPAESDSESDRESFCLAPAEQPVHWHAGDSDEENPEVVKRDHLTSARILNVEDDSADDDLPLSAAIRKTARTKHVPTTTDNIDDDDRPLAAVLQTMKNEGGTGTVQKSIQDRHTSVLDEDDDDTPLALGRSPIADKHPAAANSTDILLHDDDQPLGLKLAEHQQRQSDYHPQMMLAQQQHMMMESQLRHSFMFGPSSFIAPQMHTMPHNMPPPVLAPGFAVPLHDANKFGRVDEWRRRVE